MSATITDDSPRNPEPTEDIFLDKIDDYLVVIGSGGNRLNPFGHIINSNKNVLMSKWREKGSHEIDAPNIKNFDKKNWV